MSAVVNAGRTVHDSMAAWLLRRVSDVTLWMLTLTAIWLIWRRSAGGFARPLSEPWLIGLHREVCTQGLEGARQLSAG